MDKLFANLVSDLAPVRRRRPLADAAVLAALCLAELALWLALGEARPDLTRAAASAPTFWWKLGSFAVIAVLGAGAAIASLDPSVSPRRGLIGVAIAFGLYLALGGLMGGPFAHQSLVQRLNWREGIDCLGHLVLLSAPVMAGLGLLARRGASTHVGGTALASGVAAAGWAAFVFAFSCRMDDPLYVLVWYTLGFLISGALSQLVLTPLARW